MSTQLNPQEIFLLERYTSLSYFGELRDTWEEMVKHVEACLESFMQNLPAKYRARPLSQQPDVVWGHRVLPNFRKTLQNLNTGFILVSHGDVKGLDFAHGPTNDFIGQLEYPPDWMSTEDRNRYQALLTKAKTMAANISFTEGAYWNPLALSKYSEYRGPLNPPDRWPTYLLNKNVRISTDAKTEQSGIYVPDVADSCAEFLSTEYEQAPPASVLVGFKDLLDPITGEKYGEQPLFEKRSCVWYLVERASVPNVPHQGQPADSRQNLRVPAGEKCPETGFYFTPARFESRKLFQKDDVMPAFDTGYGVTIWQWDGNET